MESFPKDDTRSSHSHISEKKDVTYLEQVTSGGDNIHNDRIDPEVAKYASAKAIYIDEETNKRLKRMIDKRVLVVMCVTYFLQSLDKATLSFSAIMGIQADTGLVGQEYAWLSTCIYIGILVVEYPMNYIIQRAPIGKWLGFCVFSWAVVLCFHALCKNFVSLLVVRTLLGIFESACQPTFIALSGMWYTKAENAMTITLWFMMNGLQQIFGGLLAYAFTNITTGPLKSWQWLFLSYGIISVIWALFVTWYLPDSPMRAKCFSEEDKKLMVERVRSNQTGLQNRKFRMDQAIDAFKDPQVYCYGLFQLFTTLPQSSIGAFANIIINGLGFSVLNTQLLAMVLGALIMGFPLASAYLVRKYNQTILTMIGFLIPSMIGTIVLMTVANTSASTRAGLLVAYYIVLSFWGASTLTLTLLSKNVGGQTKKSIAVAVNFFCWAAGNAIGPQVMQSKDAPRYFTGFAVHMGCYVCAILTLLFLRFHFVRQNKKKREFLASKETEVDNDLAHSFDDLTDCQNPNFMYIY
ncbi:major facilitator superfamily domain-containing protein [Umbelopsis sp. PMI_123]|nr:major facilitator superfamily domain-containing protein [Umbelopsis sp. PMI_123]